MIIVHLVHQSTPIVKNSSIQSEMNADIRKVSMCPYSKGSFLLSCVVVHTGALGWHPPLKGREVFIHHSSLSLQGLCGVPCDPPACVGVSKQCPDLLIIHSLVHGDCGISLVRGGNDNGFCFSVCFDGLLFIWGEVGG